MKNTLKSIVFSLLIILTFSSIAFPIEPNFKITIKGVDHALQDGLKPSEFAELKVESTNQDIKIESMEITLARGNRAVENSQVKGNAFNLHKYVGSARSGDRIVIEIKKMNSENEPLSADTNHIIAIKVN